jgi:hypothetical protein
MNTTSMYVINAILVLLVIRQIREHPLDRRHVMLPVVAVAAAAVMFARAVPGGGADIALELAGVATGAVMGALAGLATKMRHGRGGQVLARAGWLAAGLWITGVGGRMVCAFAAAHGAGPAIARFSAAHQITGAGAWIAALVLMALADVLTRLAVLFVRGRRMATRPAAGPATAAAPMAATTRG